MTAHYRCLHCGRVVTAGRIEGEWCPGCQSSEWEVLDDDDVAALHAEQLTEQGRLL